MAGSTQKRRLTDEAAQTRDAGPSGAQSPIWRQAATRFGWGSLTDGVLGGTGCAVALACAGFAIYMTGHPQPAFNGIEHLMIFAQPNYHDEPALDVADVPAVRKGIDYSATGTIRAPGSIAPSTPDFSQPIVRAYSLHYVHEGEALIVGKDDAVYRVVLGSMVPGVGRVIAIEEQHGQWVVVTSRGLIVAR